MADYGIRVESLGKRFRITPADVNPRRAGWRRRPRRVPLWALREISFDVPQGSTLGVIGRNGAGKTTLLKLLSRITPPTEGRIRMRGKASSLLEVGTGFHPELTGRENVYLNGAVLGMRRKEIDDKFSDIVEFSEVGDFIDTPVKRYSSGMSLRLAFSVAAHLDPEILLVDEVLAVGDASFQRRSLGKMEEATNAGRTVVLVSHSMATIASLADRCIWIDGGRVAADGTPSEVIARYMGSVGSVAEGEVDDLRLRERAPHYEQNVALEAVRLVGPDGRTRSEFYEGEPIEIEVDMRVTEPVPFLELRAYVRTIQGLWLFTALSGKRPATLERGLYRASTRIDPNHLAPGVFRVDFTIGSGIPQDGVEDAVRFEIMHSLEGYDDPVLRSDVGHLRFPFSWSEPSRVE